MMKENHALQFVKSFNIMLNQIRVKEGCSGQSQPTIL